MTAVITKISANELMLGLNSIILKLELKEGTTVLYSKNFSVKHRNGSPISESIVKVKTSMQENIDRYKRETTIFNSTQLNNAITTLQSELIV